MELPQPLRAALEQVLAGVPVGELTSTVDQLIAAYRGGQPAAEPFLASPLHCLAYAGYRMPATYAALHAAMGHLAQVWPEFAPVTMTDLGGGTGAAAWAAAERFTGLTEVTVVDQVAAALSLGRRLARGGAPPALQRAQWRNTALGEPFPEADLVTVSYVLGELPTPARAALVRQAAGAAGGVVLVVEPGTPAGYQNIIEARAQLIDAGLSIVAPCPHAQACPIPPGRDWCHFSARVSRSSLHRRLKAAQLGHEDEKFSYVAAGRGHGAGPRARIVRRPQQRKGLVLLNLCTPGDGLAQRVVSRRDGDDYRLARDARWGDQWGPYPLPGS